MTKPSASSALSDLLALGETAFSVFLGASKEMKGHLEEKRDSLVQHFDLVSREEFDAAFAMIKKMRKVQTDLEKRIAVIEEKMTLSSPQKRSVKKTISKKK
ncbi:MAG: accessory factor UbiK family protein [Bdellovibrionales bacterium]